MVDKSPLSGMQKSEAAGVRTVALFEATKGLLVVIAGLGLLALAHRDAQEVAEALVRHLHLNPARHYPRIFIQAAARVNDTRLWFLACGAFVYAAIRFIEAYGLWYMRAWAEWFAIISGAIYLPVEVYELIHRVTPVKAVVLAVNVTIVSYMVWVRFYTGRRPG
jgi:uncharacterized membrane protein (DUF2068 family)